MDIFTQDVIPLTFTRIRANALVTGLTVSVTVKDAASGAVILTATSCPEITPGAGVYTFNWTHGLNQNTLMIATYTVTGGQIYSEYFYFTVGDPTGHAA